MKTPNRQTLWSADSTTLTPDKPVTLTWDNGAGLKFKRVIAVDDKYMFTVHDSVENDGAEPVSLRPYALILRRGKPDVAGYAVLHEGFVGVIGDGSVQEITYPNIEKETGRVRELKGDGGWLGFTDKYWALGDHSRPVRADRRALLGERSGAARGLPDRLRRPGDRGRARRDRACGHGAGVRRREGSGDDRRLREGPRHQEVRSDDRLGLVLFHHQAAVPPDRLHLPLPFVGNFGIAILIVTVLIKLAFFPLANQSYRSMAKMKKIQPQIAALKDLYPDDRAKQQQAQMELFKKEGVNPVAGCLPMVIQIPVFFALYKVIFITIEMRHAPFFGWIKDLSAPRPDQYLHAVRARSVGPDGRCRCSATSSSSASGRSSWASRCSCR